jgi:glutathione S-transferase
MLEFFELAPSPNNTKLRMALRFKGIPFEAIPVDPFDRTAVVELSGQELTPAIRDRGVVLNDSEAILHYLDANYRDTPRLIPGDREGRKRADAWKQRLDEELVPHWLPGFLTVLKLRDAYPDDERAAFADALGRLEEELGDRDTFDAEAPICDLRVAEWATYALPGDGLLARVPLFARCREVFGVAPGSFPRLETLLAPWNERLA